jgi:hypothetical protein
VLWDDEGVIKQRDTPTYLGGPKAERKALGNKITTVEGGINISDSESV